MPGAKSKAGNKRKQVAGAASGDSEPNDVLSEQEIQMTAATNSASVSAPSGGSSASSAPAAKKNKQKSKGNQEDFSLKSLDRDARKQAWARIKVRLQSAFLLNLVQDALSSVRGAALHSPRDEKKGGTPTNKGASKKTIAQRISELRSFIQSNFMAIFSLFCVFMLFYMKASQEGYQGDQDDGGMNPYDALGVSPRATQAEIKKVYKKLALEWHPDKHAKDCDSCAKRFHEITVAFGKIGEPDKRKAYDSNRSAKKDVLTNSNSIKLTPEVWLRDVSKSNEVWLILFYDGHDSSGGMFPVFEELSLKHGNYVRYAHCDVTSPEGAKVQAMYPQKFVIHPVISRYVYGEYPELWTPGRGETEGSGVKALRRFIYETYPTNRVPFVPASNVGDWMNENDVLFVTPSSQMIPSNPGVGRLSKEEWKGFTQRNVFAEQPEKLLPVESVLGIYKYGLRFTGPSRSRANKAGSGMGQQMRIGITSKDELFHYLLQVKQGSSTAEEEELGRKAFLFFHLLEQQWGNKWQDSPYLAITPTRNATTLPDGREMEGTHKFQLLYLPGKQSAQNAEFLKRHVVGVPPGRGGQPVPSYSRADYLDKHGKFPVEKHPTTLPLELRQATNYGYLRHFFRPYLKAAEMWEAKFGSCFNIYEATSLQSFVEMDENGGNLIRDALGGVASEADDVPQNESPELCDTAPIAATRAEEFKLLVAESPEKASGHLIEQFLQDVANRLVLPVDQSNYPVLCRVGTSFARTRNYCLFIEAGKLKPTGAAAAVLRDLEKGKQIYAKELGGGAEANSESDADTEEENFETRLQAVVYQGSDLVGTAKLWPVSAAFHAQVTSRSELEGYDYLVVEAETKRVAPIRSKDVKLEDLFTSLAFEDLTLIEDFPELRYLLATDRVTFYDEITEALLSSWLRILLTYVAVVTFLSFLPETKFLVSQAGPVVPAVVGVLVLFVTSYSTRKMFFSLLPLL
ncbi:unnamed protein product [Amoebophrya sp. A120]|nr:unnamed protein product [Amoebophrya sp. A120]|eukprot:GSA120T00015209001.1